MELIKDFLEYLGKEEINLTTSLVNFRQEFDLFGSLDLIYQEPWRRLDIKSTDESGMIIGQLYLFVHFYLYFSISCIMRSHLSEAFSSMRKAIDATLSAYKIILDPSLTKAYIERNHNDHNKFEYVKNTIEKEIKKDSTAYPLAKELLKLHESCSEYGCHADFNSFAYRLEFQEISKDTSRMVMNYFQFPKNQTEYKMYFIIISLSFWHMFKIFKLFFDEKLKIIDTTWENNIIILGQELNKLREQYFNSIKTSGANSVS